ncbi:hypothetical protein [Allosalinactinospora lopnorensis]|uniref:hypothetical protein n=1 Tax=Allosalinactinospora lopnorensis TaxID=1352348 RepID=UPI0012E1BCC7|nr:hypothetical protein [Allosalinactinospora lopnorensis]
MTVTAIIDGRIDKATYAHTLTVDSGGAGPGEHLHANPKKWRIPRKLRYRSNTRFANLTSRTKSVQRTAISITTKRKEGSGERRLVTSQ